jgi:hypothetical protein
LSGFYPYKATIYSVKLLLENWKHYLEEGPGPCWDGYKKVGMKKKGNKMVPNCVPLEEEVIEEKDDACTRKVKSRYKVWPSAYASGALVKCRKVGAANWGNKSKKNEQTELFEGEESLEAKIRKALIEEGGAAGMKALKDHTKASEKEIKEAIKGMSDVGLHEDGDYILQDDEEIDVKKTLEPLDEKSDFSKEEKEGLHGWFSRQGAKGKVGGWIDCNTGKPCGRQKGEKRAKPRCRPTKAQCKGYKRPDERNENMKISKELLEGIIFEETRRFMFETNVLPHLDEAFLEDGSPVCVGCLAEQLDAASCDCPDLVYEAEYQGRKVTLNKPTRGDVKKFKVYVKDPKTGNVKKVNFGHGGSSAKAKGEKTMKIRKSNPKARKNFRARHNCDNPGPKTKARYWSCKKW